MSFFSNILGFLSGGVGGKIVEVVADHFPPGMTEKERILLEKSIQDACRDYEFKLISMAQKEQEGFNQRIKDLEGTASDLNQAGGVGKIVLFLRGLQRPLWGFAVLIIDWMVFSGAWNLTENNLQSAFWIINFLVLGFLFGERTLKNLAPLYPILTGKQQEVNENKKDQNVVNESNKAVG